MNKILLACPISDQKRYIIFDWLKHIKKLDGTFDVLLVDNSKTIDLSFELSKLGISCKYYSPIKNDAYKRQTMANCLEIIREYALNNNYDYFFSLECDIFPPVDIIATLLKMQTAELSPKECVTGATYFIDTAQNSRLMIQRLEPETEAGGKSIIRNLTIDESFLFANGHVKYAFAIGFGCVLIPRSVLEKIKFRLEKSIEVHADSIFYRDLYSLQIPVMVHTGIICPHYNQDWGIIKNNL